MSNWEHDPPRSVAGLASEAVRAAFRASTDVAACVMLARHITRLVGKSFERFQTREPIACRLGCNFCCYLRVMVYPHEAIALAHYRRSEMPEEQAAALRERLQIADARLRALDPAQPTPTVACAFLVDGRCSVYEMRPATCAGHHSLQRGSCERRFETLGGRVGVPVSRALQEAAVTVREEVGQAVSAEGLAASRVELQTAVLALLRKPALIGNWLSGGEWESDARGLVRGE